MFSRNGCYRKTPKLRVRPVPEMDACIVFTPARPNLYTLNPTAWLVLELCDGATGKALEARYYHAVEPLLTRGEARAELHRIVEDLEHKGIVEQFNGSDSQARRRILSAPSNGRV